MKKSLSQAIALAALLGAAATTQAAITVNENGTGGALLYPLYTVENGNSTLVSVTNTTDEYKAVKVRFLEGMNSVEVLDFHLYLSPQDVWSGSIVATENGAKLLSNDTSCVVGLPNGFPAEGLDFRDYEIVTDSKYVNADGDTVTAEGANTSIKRGRVGHFEVIEMGTIDPAYAVTEAGKAGVAGTDATLGEAIKHVDGEPGNCAVLTKMWNTGGVWEEAVKAGGNEAYTPTDIGFLAAPTEPGGLYGTAAVVNVAGGWAASYDAVALLNDDAAALTGIYTGVQHPRPGSIYPNLATGGLTANATGATDYDMLDDIYAAISAKNVFNDYYIDPALNAETDLVISYPTKRFYVNEGTAEQRTLLLAGVDNPFSNGWNLAENQACDAIAMTYFDKEEEKNTVELEDVGLISPLPPAQTAEPFSLCYETNILSIGNDSNVYGGELVRKVYPLQEGFTEGWLNVDLNVTAEASALDGLPVIGFATILTQNGNAGGKGVLGNFAQTFKHKVAK